MVHLADLLSMRNCTRPESCMISYNNYAKSSARIQINYWVSHSSRCDTAAGMVCL